MAYISFTDTIGAAVLRNAHYPTVAGRFAQWTPMTRPIMSSAPQLSNGAIVAFTFRTDYGASFDVAPVALRTGSSPAAPTVAGSAVGGTLPAGTYYYSAGGVAYGAEVAASAETSVVTTGTTSSVALSVPAVPGILLYRWYRGTVAGAPTHTITSPGPSITDTNQFTAASGLPLAAGPDMVTVADRLIVHLLSGGTCTVGTEDTPGNTYATCGLMPGSTPSLRMTDRQHLEYTLSLQLINLAGTRMVCRYV